MKKTGGAMKLSINYELKREQNSLFKVLSDALREIHKNHPQLKDIISSTCKYN
jgi:hypothetical protein